MALSRGKMSAEMTLKHKYRRTHKNNYKQSHFRAVSKLVQASQAWRQPSKRLIFILHNIAHSEYTKLHSTVMMCHCLIHSLFFISFIDMLAGLTNQDQGELVNTFFSFSWRVVHHEYQLNHVTFKTPVKAKQWYLVGFLNIH